MRKFPFPRIPNHRPAILLSMLMKIVPGALGITLSVCAFSHEQGRRVTTRIDLLEGRIEEDPYPEPQP